MRATVTADGGATGRGSGSGSGSGADGGTDRGADSGAGLLVVDAANVVGARPDGWWRDRAGAAERLVTALATAVDLHAELRGWHVVVVLEGRASDAVVDDRPHLRVVRAPRDGDDAIVDVVADATGGASADATASDAADATGRDPAEPTDQAGVSGGDVVVVTSDRELRRRVGGLGAQVRGAGWLRDLLDDHGDVDDLDDAAP